VVLNRAAAGLIGSRSAPPNQLWSAWFARRANRVRRRQKGVTLPAAFLVQVGESVATPATAATRSADINSDRFARRPTAVVPFLNNGVIGSRTQGEECVDLRAGDMVSELARSGVNAHRRNAFRTTGLGGGDVLHSSGNVAVISRRTDEDPCESGGGPSHTKG
jgi:hypothetical protein